MKKAIRISNTAKQYTLEPIERKENLSGEEKRVYDTLFPDNKSLTVTDKNHKIFTTAMINLIESLQSSWSSGSSGGGHSGSGGRGW